MEDNLLLEMFKQNDINALTECEKKYSSELIAFSYNITGSKEDAKECLNDAMLKAWNSIPIDPPENLRAYLYRIVRNLSLDKLRRSSALKRGTIKVAIDELGDCIPSRESCVDVLKKKELAREIENWLNTLDKEKRVIFVKRYFLMIGTRQLAKSLNVKEGTLASTLSRLRSSLKKYLEEKGYTF